jgi:hypothetical protein
MKTLVVLILFVTLVCAAPLGETARKETDAALRARRLEDRLALALVQPILDAVAQRTDKRTECLTYSFTAHDLEFIDYMRDELKMKENAECLLRRTLEGQHKLKVKRSTLHINYYGGFVISSSGTVDMGQMVEVCW